MCRQNPWQFISKLMHFHEGLKVPAGKQFPDLLDRNSLMHMMLLLWKGKALRYWRYGRS